MSVVRSEEKYDRGVRLLSGLRVDKDSPTMEAIGAIAEVISMLTLLQLFDQGSVASALSRMRLTGYPISPTKSAAGCPSSFPRKIASGWVTPSGRFRQRSLLRKQTGRRSLWRPPTHRLQEAYADGQSVVC